jgi:PilZ domain-containing protein
MSRTIRSVRERRRDRRITLRKPVLASVNAAPVFVLDVSSGGVRVAHRSQLPPPGAVCRLDVPGESGPITLDCAIVHTVSQHAESAAESLFQSGLRIVSGDAARMAKIIGRDKKRDEG